MDLNKIKSNELVEDNAFLVSQGVKGFVVVDKQSIGAVKTVDFQNTITKEIVTVTVEGTCIKYDGRKIDLSNMLAKISKILRVKL